MDGGEEAVLFDEDEPSPEEAAWKAQDKFAARLENYYCASDFKCLGVLPGHHTCIRVDV